MIDVFAFYGGAEFFSAFGIFFEGCLLLVEDFREEVELGISDLVTGDFFPGGFDAGFIGALRLHEGRGEMTRGFGELRVVEEDEGLGRAVGDAAFNGADFERGLIEDEHVVLRLSTTPEGVERAAIGVSGIGLRVVKRVVGSHGWAALLGAKKAGAEEGGVADRFAAETMGRAAGKEIIRDVS